ncbi:MAG: hypothetical protein O9252_02240, partial [Algoriphagus sp.]|nr:hypothetical protein [Algoriphagus sp.]
MSALNINYTPFKKWRLTGFLIASASDNELGSNSLRTYLNVGENVQEKLNSVSQVENKSALGKYTLTFTPKEETYVKYSLFGKISEIANSNQQESDFGQNLQNIASLNTRTPYSLQQK